MIVADENKQILTVASTGFGKQSKVTEFRRTGRGGQGIIAMQLPEEATLVAASGVDVQDDIFLITSGSTLVRISACEVSTIGRSTKGVRLLRLKSSEELVAAQVFSNEMLAEESEADTQVEE
jgi:DNA gyrase subunit A